MKRLWRWVVGWLKFTPPQPLPISQAHGEGLKADDRPMWVDAGLVGMKQEIGLVFREYPPVWRIAARLTVTLDDALWIWNACQFDDRVWALVTINDVARAVIEGVPITEIRRRGLVVMQMSPEWERGKS